MGAVLLCGGHEGQALRVAECDIMIHQVQGGAQGAASDVEIQVEFMFKLKHRLNSIICQPHRQTDRAGREGLRPRLLHDAEEAKAYGLVDEVVQSRKEIPGFPN